MINCFISARIIVISSWILIVDSICFSINVWNIFVWLHSWPSSWITRSLKGPPHGSLTAILCHIDGLDKFYALHNNCNFNSRYYMTDFVELCRYHQCIGKPIVQLQKTIQKQIPGVDYWEDFDRAKSLIDRKIDLEFFLFKKTRHSLTNQKFYRDTCDTSLPQVMGDKPLPSLPPASLWRKERNSWLAKATQMANVFPFH